VLQCVAVLDHDFGQVIAFLGSCTVCSVMQSVGMRCSVLHYVAVCCCSVLLQCVAVSDHDFDQFNAILVSCSVCSVMQCVGMRCFVLQCVVAVCCSVLHYWITTLAKLLRSWWVAVCAV